MATPGSSFTPIPLVHEDNLEVRYHPRVKTLQWHLSRFTFPHPEVGGAAVLGVDHIFVRLKAQVQDYVEVRNPKITAQLIEVLVKFEERYSCKKMQGSRNSGNVERRGWNESRRSNHGDRQRNWRNSEVFHRTSNGRNNYRGN
ncbi:uncharacterized protein TNCV_4091631 [Trichonephila clavipes]|nr:uncharacterized protein TNCV_4091631 [Trichonephila clavipes]